jgi:hypothetical protein
MKENFKFKITIMRASNNSLDRVRNSNLLSKGSDTTNGAGYLQASPSASSNGGGGSNAYLNHQ